MEATSATAARGAARPAPPRPLVPALALVVVAIACLGLLAVHIHRAFGLPAHPLILHVPVVLVPLLALALLAVAVRGDWLERFAVQLGVFAVVTMAFTILTAGAGDAFLHDRLDAQRARSASLPGAVKARMSAEAHRLHEHADSGEMLRLVMIVLTAVVLIAVVLVALRRSGDDTALGRIARAAPTLIGFRALFVVGAVLVTFLVIRTGHLGAELTWGEHGPPAGGGPPPGLKPGSSGTPPRSADEP